MTMGQKAFTDMTDAELEHACTGEEFTMSSRHAARMAAAQRPASPPIVKSGSRALCVQTLSGGSGYTLSCEAGRLVITGGTHHDAYAPADIAAADIPRFLSNLLRFVEYAFPAITQKDIEDGEAKA